MTLPLFVAIIMTFLLMMITVKAHSTLIKVEEYYQIKTTSRQERAHEFEKLNVELLTVVTEYKAKYAELKSNEGNKICGLDSTKECNLCDDKCLFRNKEDK